MPLDLVVRRVERACQQAVAGRLYDPAPVFGDFWIDEFAAVNSEPSEGAGFVLAHEAAVSGDIGGEDSRKPALYPLSAHDALSLDAIPFEFSSRRVF